LFKGIDPVLSEQLRSVMSKQRWFQIRQNRKGLCQKCTNKVVKGKKFCLRHINRKVAA
jgi:hypothetical protein